MVNKRDPKCYQIPSVCSIAVVIDADSFCAAISIWVAPGSFTFTLYAHYNIYHKKFKSKAMIFYNVARQFIAELGDKWKLMSSDKSILSLNTATDRKIFCTFIFDA